MVVPADMTTPQGKFCSFISSFWLNAASGHDGPDGSLITGNGEIQKSRRFILTQIRTYNMVHIEWSILHVAYNLCREFFWGENGHVWKRNGPFPVYNLDFRSSDFRSLFLILVVWLACSNKSSSSYTYKQCIFSSCIIRKFISKL